MYTNQNTLRPAYIPAIAIVHTFLPVHGSLSSHCLFLSAQTMQANQSIFSIGRREQDSEYLDDTHAFRHAKCL